MSRRIRVVNNGIPDPCPDFVESILPRRKARYAARAKLFNERNTQPGELEKAGGDPQVVRVLYLAHCTREKGLFAAAQAVLAPTGFCRRNNRPCE